MVKIFASENFAPFEPYGLKWEESGRFVRSLRSLIRGRKIFAARKFLTFALRENVVVSAD